MAVKVETVDTLREYFKGVTGRANHHAQNVNEVVYTLLGVIILLKDDGTDIEVRGSVGSTGNILWVYIGAIRYAFRYEHSNGGSIEIRENSYNGPIKLTVTNGTSLNQILSTF
ncbi:MAG: hypothetical protein EOO43_14190 [Flavobacterium sp.]|nr:MAG: hypothetical protein EOO43_14190 [Flavobacterium sp.]